jgi:glutamyl-tRNA synthetase
LFSREQMVELFDIGNANRAASRFDLEKLSWINQQYIKNDEPLELVADFTWQLRALGIDPDRGPEPVDVIVALRERAQTLKEMAEKARVWYAPLEEYDEAAVSKHLKSATAIPALQAVHQQLSDIRDWSVENVHAAIAAAAAAIGEGMGKVAQPLRVAITGTQVSPSIDHTVFLAGRDQALQRVEAAIVRAGG